MEDSWKDFFHGVKDICHASDCEWHTNYPSRHAATGRATCSR
jgi:hypothetical protein